jgi:hypothetical protein
VTARIAAYKLSSQITIYGWSISHRPFVPAANQALRLSGVGATMVA